MSFPADYSWELNPEFSGDGSTEVIRVGGPGVVAYALKISPSGGEPWIAQVRSGDVSYRSSGVRATPHPDVLAVFAHGAGYLVNTRDRSVEELAYPVIQVEEAPDAGLLLIADFTDLEAIGPDGVVWRSGRLTFDDLEIVDVDGDRILCGGSVDVEELATGSRSRFTVDVRTGKQLSGTVFVDPFGGS